MKNLKLRRIMSMMLAAALVLCASLTFRAAEADAASGPLKLEDTTMWAKDPFVYIPDITSDDMNVDVFDAKFVSVKSSNKKVIKLIKFSDPSNVLTAYEMKALKKGKSKITLTYKLKGKKYKVSKTYTVKSYPNPFKSLKLNGKKINLRKNKYEYGKKKLGKTVKVKAVPSKGWKIESGTLTFSSITGDAKYKFLSKSNISKGKSFKVPSNFYRADIDIYMINNKDERLHYHIYLENDN